MNATLQQTIKGWLPYALGALLVVQFLALSVWQAGRAQQKLTEQRAYDAQSGFAPFTPGMAVRPYQPLLAEGKYDAAHQVLLDNIILDNRYGRYVLTPLTLTPPMQGADAPVLLVNRGWTERVGDGTVDAAVLAVGGGTLQVRGRVGALPKPGYRMGEPFAGSDAWPRHAVYPTLQEIAQQLGREVQPFVLLLDPQQPHGLVRHWVPEEMGPGQHAAYAFQWFAMAAVLAGLLIWNYRRRGLET